MDGMLNVGHIPDKSTWNIYCAIHYVTDDSRTDETEAILRIG